MTFSQMSGQTSYTLSRVTQKTGSLAQTELPVGCDRQYFQCGE
jgi:hypothetical protein